MRAKIFFVTLAVADLGRSFSFYREGLGWPTIAQRQAPRAYRLVHGCPGGFRGSGALALGISSQRGALDNPRR
jgi:hypothetical protein